MTVTVTVMLVAMLMQMVSQDRIATFSSPEMKKLMAQAQEALVKTLGAIIKMDIQSQVEDVLCSR